jgi:hypothetical protein
LPWPLTAFTERYCIKGPSPVLPELRADVRDQIPLVISTCFIKEDIGSDLRYRFWMGRKAELGHVLEKQKNDGGCVGLYRTILHQVSGFSCQSCVPMSVIKFPRHFRTCFIKKILALQMRGTDSHDWGRKMELGHVLVKLFVINLRHVVP